MTTDLKNLSELLRDHAAVLQELAESLRRQRDSIIHWDLKSLSKEQRVHNQLLMRLRVFDSARNTAFDKICEERGLLGRPAPMDLLSLIEGEDGEDLRRHYENLMAVAGVVKELYQDTQKYLSHSLMSVDMSLGVLRSSKQGTGYTRSNDAVEVPSDCMEKRFVDQSF